MLCIRRRFYWLNAMSFRVASLWRSRPLRWALMKRVIKKNTHRQKRARLPDSGFVSSAGRVIMLRRIATGMRGVTGGFEL